MKKNISLKIEGMMCMHCAKRTEDALKTIKGVSKVKIDLENHEASLIYKNDDLSVFETVINEIGYKLISLEEK